VNHDAVRRPVKLGLRGEGRVEIVDGLNAGDRVIAAAGAGIVPGQRVRATGAAAGST
jgi:HlyD family secretion protein